MPTQNPNAFEGVFKALRQKVKRSELTDPRYGDSFGGQITDLVGYKRWVLAGTALEVWEGDLRARVDELVSVHEGEIYKGHHIRSSATARHCWMMGLDVGRARPSWKNPRMRKKPGSKARTRP